MVRKNRSTHMKTNVKSLRKPFNSLQVFSVKLIVPDCPSGARSCVSESDANILNQKTAFRYLFLLQTTFLSNDQGSHHFLIAQHIRPTLYISRQSATKQSVMI